MTTRKSGEDDRDRVIKYICQKRSVSLSRIRNWRKLLQDQHGDIYLILVGRGNWHGIQNGMMDFMLEANSKVFLSVSFRTKSAINIYFGNAGTLISKRKFLTITQEGDYHLDVKKGNSEITLLQIPELSLEAYGSVDAPSHIDNLPKNGKSINELKKVYDNMSLEEKEEFLRKLKET
jgi:hypothetical protein